MAKAKIIVAKAALVYIFYLRAKARSKAYNINLTTLCEEKEIPKIESRKKANEKTIKFRFKTLLIIHYKLLITTDPHPLPPSHF